MAQQIINVGAAANDRTGDTWRDAMIKANSNFTEIYTSVNAISVTFVTQESDFPNQDVNNIYIDGYYWVTASFSTAKKFVVTSDFAVFTCGSTYGPTVTFTGTGDMFSGTDTNFYMHDANVDAGIGNRTFNFVDTIGGQKLVTLINVIVANTASFGRFEDMNFVGITNSSCANAADGIDIIGTSTGVVSIYKLGLISTSASFIGINLNSSQAFLFEFDNLFISAPSGAFGISGLASNGNVPTGRRASVNNCEFFGAMTDLQNITVNDVRWNFSGNTPTRDSMQFGLLSLIANTTQTVAPSSPTLVAGTWTVEDTSFFTGTTGGRLTYNGERDIYVDIGAVVSIEPASGSNKSLSTFIALNGTVIANSARTVVVSAGSPQSVTSQWLLQLSNGDYLEMFVQNNTDAINILVSSAIMKVD